jgi:TonB family protein
VLRAAAGADRSSGYPVKVIRSDEYPGSFSLFSFVVVNPSVSETEAREILNHELVHIRQMHWFDLVLSSFLCACSVVQSCRMDLFQVDRQNHEYLADEEALQRSSDPAVYKAVLLNQIAGSPVIDLGNFFSYSLNKKRFLMMKNKISSPYRKLRLLLILPVAALVLFAFAKPEYRVMEGSDGPLPVVAAADNAAKNVSGTVKDDNGKPLEGAVVLCKGTTVGTTSDASGRFALKDVPDDAVLVISYVGFETKAVSVKAAGPDVIAEIHVLKGEQAVAKYGEKGKDGVIEITTKKNTVASPDKQKEVTVTGYGKEENRDVFVIVEEMPEFPGGMEAMMLWISQRVKYPEQAKKDGITGLVMVSFIVNKAGKVTDISVERSAHPLLDAEAVRVIGEMPAWKPGTQHGKAVEVRMTVPVKFSLR